MVRAVIDARELSLHCSGSDRCAQLSLHYGSGRLRKIIAYYFDVVSEKISSSMCVTLTPRGTVISFPLWHL